MDTRIEQIINKLSNGASTSTHLKFPCSICNKNVLANQKALQCDICKTWTHIKCSMKFLESLPELELVTGF